MARKFKLLILLAAAWAALYFLLTVGESAPLLSASAHPSDRALPIAWSDQSRPTVVLRAPVHAQQEQAPAPLPAKRSSACSSLYTVQKGDTLGAIAGRCGVTIDHLKAVNPTLPNPNRIYPGQQLTIDGLPSSPTTPVQAQSSSGFSPGSTIEVQSSGFPPNAQVRIGIGLSITGYRLITSATTDAQGNLSALVTIPANARSGEIAFVLLATHNIPTIQAISDTFRLAP